MPIAGDKIGVLKSGEAVILASGALSESERRVSDRMLEPVFATLGRVLGTLESKDEDRISVPVSHGSQSYRATLTAAHNRMHCYDLVLLERA